MTPYFLTITINQKADNDWRAFLDWANRDEMMVYQIRGYSMTSPGEAANDAWRKFNEDPEGEVCGCWKWE